MYILCKWNYIVPTLPHPAFFKGFLWLGVVSCYYAFIFADTVK